MIYIPVWLDQKPLQLALNNIFGANLHSSMVRLETATVPLLFANALVIYIPVWLDQKLIVPCDYDHLNKRFTFQYGQIRNG